MIRGLPGGFLNAGNLSLSRELTEADATDAKESHEAVASAAQVTAVVHTRRETHFPSISLCAEIGLKLGALLVLEGGTSHGQGIG